MEASLGAFWVRVAVAALRPHEKLAHCLNLRGRNKGPLEVRLIPYQNLFLEKSLFNNGLELGRVI
jgi:hypothetical protein